MTIYGAPKKDSAFTREIKLGANGLDVRVMQEALVAAGYKIKVDNLAGNETMSAWRKFEKDHNFCVANGKASMRELMLLTLNTEKSQKTQKFVPFQKDSFLNLENFKSQKNTYLPTTIAPEVSAKAPIAPLAVSKIAANSKRVVIDIGHVGFGADEGAEGKFNGQKVTEGQINKAVADLVKQKLEAAGVNVVIATGHDHAQHNRTKNLIGRANVAKNNKADIFIRVHPQ